ncbi:MAG: peptidyl-prolyl cis-trans isomerase [Deltaproteobacteria bacterium]|nr:peptidyl-prolyl cis-trans isomerase [Deltaproteobacteria bacterium]
MRLKKSHLAGFAAAGILFLSAFGCTGEKEGAKAVARVGEQAITEDRFKDALKRLMPAGHAATKEDLVEIKKDLLNQLIEEELILGEAKRSGVLINDSEVSAEVEGIKKEYGDESFKETINERYGNQDSWKEEIRRKLLVRKTVDRLVGSKITVTEEAARKYYDEHIRDYDVPEQVHARMIVIASEEEARKIRKKLTSKNFAEVAGQVTLSPDRKSGGDLGFFARGDMPDAFEEAVFKLKPGSISPVVKTDYGYHIFLVEEKKKGGTLEFGEVKDKIIEKLRSENTDAELRKWLSSLKKSTRIEVREDLP